MDKRWTFFSADFELSARCAQSCRMCPRRAITRRQGLMDLERFRELAPALAERHVRVTFCGMGSPVLNPRWPEFVKIYRGLGGFCGITIHAAELTDAVAEGLMACGPNVVEASFPSVDPDAFGQLCPDAPYALALERLERLIAWPHRCFAVVPVGVQTALNPEEPKRAATFWRARGVVARVAPLHSRGGHLTETRFGTFADAGLVQPCGLFAIHAFIAWNGDLLSCCHDLSGETVMGNVFADDLDTLMTRKKDAMTRIPHFGVCDACSDAYRLNPVPDKPFPETKSARRKVLQRLAGTS